MSDYNPNNPAFDVMLSVENIMKNMKPKKMESEATKGMLSRRTPTVKESMQDGRMQMNHELSFSGASDKINYFISSSYTDQEGTVIGSGFDRITVRTNVNADLNDWISTGVALTASRTNDDPSRCKRSRVRIRYEQRKRERLI